MSGVATACWAPMVPFVKARLHLDEAELGSVLLCMGIGSVAAMPLAGWLSHRVGNRAVMVVTGLLVAIALPALAIAPSTPTLVATLTSYGAAMGILDVTMNAHAVEVERLHGRPLMSGFHGLFSAGGLVGSAGLTALLGAGVTLEACAAAAAVALLVVVVVQRSALLGFVRPAPEHRQSAFAMPSPRMLLLGILCFIVFLAEGSMLDWSAVLLRSERGVDIAHAGLGYAAFSLAMTTGRLLGDRITAALGGRRVVGYGGLIAAIGFGLATALPWPATSMLGFLLVGLGASNIVPVLFSAAGRTPGPSVGMALATVTGLGYAGIMAGPAAIGFIARATSLPLALGGVAVLLGVVAACASIVPREAP